MRWDGLFADLEAQAAALDAAERASEVDERARIEAVQFRLADRLRAGVGSAVRLRCSATLSVDGVLRRAGAEWALVDEDGRDTIVVLAAVGSISGLGRLTAGPPVSVVESRLGLRHALRAVARDRAALRIHLLDGSAVHGTLDRVGADFVELAAHLPGELRRRGDVREVLLLRVDRLAVIRRDL